MDRNNKRPQGSRRLLENSGSSRRRSYEEDYTPHYSNQNNTQKNNTKRQPRQNINPEQRYTEQGYDRHSQGNGRYVKNNSGNTQNNPEARSKRDTSTQGARKKNKHMIGRILAVIQGILSVIVMALLFLLDVVPMKFLAVVAVLLLILWVFAFFSQFTRGTHIVGKVESVLLCIILAMGCYYLFITHSFLGSISGSTIKIDNMLIAVRKDDPAQNLSDVSEYVFGIQTTLDAENTQKTLEQVNKNLGKDVATQVYDSLDQQIDALYNGEIGVIIYNEAFLENILEQHPTFNDDIRTLDNVKIETKVEVAQSDIKVTKEPFTVYITGIDTYGDISASGRSDVNILATVNPETKQILLTTTPRDYYVEFPGVTNGALDKLTHAGIYGVDCSMNTLGQLYGIKIDHYAKVNFTSVVKMVDQLGGIEVYSEYAFQSIYGYQFQQGYNSLDGETALAFVRERKNLADGDNQRGKNQQAVITAMIKKAMSPAILANYAGLLGSLDGNFETSLTMNDITELIKMQLNDGGDWNIVSQSVVGSNGEGVCYSAPGQSLYVMIPDQASIAAASAQIQKVYDGEILENTSPQ